MAVIEHSLQAGWRLRVHFTEDIFSPANPGLGDVLADPSLRKVLILLDQAVASAQPGLPARMEAYFAARAEKLRLVCPPVILPGGERAKNSPALINEIHAQIDRHHIDRHSFVIAVGGGALLDVVGFAAATAHRGVRHVRIPTTTLAQADSGVGVKNGINAFGKKNFIGTFAPPYAVINDFTLLATLPPKEMRAGYVEAVKVACIRDRKFFEEMEAAAVALAAFDPSAMRRLIYHCAELHLNHIVAGGDPFETGSARPLDFGHWAAHKLEQTSDFQIHHGEAVAIGLALDVVYSHQIGLLEAAAAGRILALLRRLGFTLFTSRLLAKDSRGELQILGGLEEFREHLGGELTITLLKEIGCGVEVHEMKSEIVVASIQELQHFA